MDKDERIKDLEERIDELEKAISEACDYIIAHNPRPEWDDTYRILLPALVRDRYERVNKK